MTSLDRELPAFASALSVKEGSREAVREACDRVAESMPAQTPIDLAVVFLSADRAEDAPQIAAELCERLQPRHLIGCTAESVVGVGCEVEWQPALSLWVARLPGTMLRPVHLHLERSPEGGAIVGWPIDLPDPWPAGTSMLLLGDPFSFPADAMLARLNEDQPGTILFGGMASGASSPGESRLILNREVYQEGAVGVMMEGGLRVRTVVSQGCRPIGRHFVITKAERNVIYELGGRPALLQLKEIFDQLPASEQALVQQGLHLGRVVNEYQDQFGLGDFLVRNVIGIEAERGAIVVGDYYRPGQTVQFHIRDAETADAEMRQLLAQLRDDAGARPQAGLLFTCNGRGTRLFQQPHHDAQAIRDALGDIPLAGLFAAGEIGPIAGKNFLHGFTASMVFFEAEPR